MKQNYVVFHSRWHTVAMGAYTVSAVIWAGYNVVRYRKFKSPLFSAAKAISLVSATVSLLSLGTALGAFFESKEEARSLTKVIGYGVCVFVFGMAFFMIVRGNRQMKKLKKDKSIEK